MSSKHSSPSKIALNKFKGKPISMAVPVIRYHASDDELDELYSVTDDEKRLTPESDKTSPKSSPRKSCISMISDFGEDCEGNWEHHSISIDENPSEGTSPSDRWKVLSDIKGKITKTFEEKLSEMKSDRKKLKTDRSRDTSSVSDYEDLGDVTPTEDIGSDILEKDSSSPILRKRTNSSKFVGFSYIKTGLKTKKSEDDSIESGIEAAELAFENENIDTNFISTDNKNSTKNLKVLTKFQKYVKCYLPEIYSSSNTILTESELLLIHLRNRIYYQLFMLVIAFSCCYFIPLPAYLTGVWAGIFVSILVQKVYNNINKLLILSAKSTSPMVEIPVVKEHVIVEKFEGWLNELRYNYEPDNYHVARTQPVYFKLEGEVLHVMETRTRIPKRDIWDEPKLKPKYTKKRIYYLSGAKIELLPSGLIRRRRWSKKYPICITFEKHTLRESTVVENSSDDEPQSLDNEPDKVIIEEDETDDELSQSKDSKDIYEDCQNDVKNEEMKVKMYIFARTDRQKEDWFRRLVSASENGSKRSSISSVKDITFSGNFSLQVNSDVKSPTPSITSSEIPSFVSYQAYMTRYVEVPSTPTAPKDADALHGVSHDGLWINALLGRILFDMHKCSDCINIIQDKIQRKLSNIKLPYFMESLLVSELVIGQGAPIIHNATKPIVDERGLWFDLDITYEGSLTMTIETKLNLMKLKRINSTINSSDILTIDKTQTARSPIFDSDVEDSPETSTEDEDSLPLTTVNSSRENTPIQSSGKKFLSMVDKLASNKYFQHATELSYVKRAMEGVSNTEIRLMVSVSSIEGCLAINIPPPPTDRFWYGFKPVPKINLTAKPAVGEIPLNLFNLPKWIETKLLKEFEKVVVIPNMVDLVIPLCPNYPFSY